jgi:hypothetical protein
MYWSVDKYSLNVSVDNSTYCNDTIIPMVERMQ